MQGWATSSSSMLTKQSMALIDGDVVIGNPHVDLNHTNSNKPIPDHSTNIRSINDSADTIKKIFSSPVHLVHTPSQVPTLRIFTYGKASEPQSTLNDSSSEIVTPKGNTTSRNKLPNPIPNLPAYPD